MENLDFVLVVRVKRKFRGHLECVRIAVVFWLDSTHVFEDGVECIEFGDDGRVT